MTVASKLERRVTQRTKKDRFVVVCDDYTSEPLTLTQAQGRLAQILEAGHCRLGHSIEPA